MLRRFLYLNETTVDSYLGVIEGGLSDETRRRMGERGTRGGDAGIKASVAAAKFSGQREHSQEEENVIRDTPEWRFDRLMNELESDPERWNYERILESEGMFDRLSTGLLMAVDCEIEVPPMSRLFAQPDQLSDMLDVLEDLGPLASAFGGSLEGMPDPEQIRAVRSFTKLKTDLVIVGDVDESAPRLAGKLDQSHLREMPDGEATLVGKVSRRWKEGEHYPLMALPGAALMSRAQRRNAEPVDPDDENVLPGPAITLDVLAIFR
jgi:hypothetical protein